MTENEAVKHAREYIKYLNHSGWEKDFDAIEKLIVATEEIQQYRAIGTIEEFKALKEKNEPKKPLRTPTDDSCLYYELRCPSCDEWLSNISRKTVCRCGQKLDW